METVLFIKIVAIYHWLHQMCYICESKFKKKINCIFYADNNLCTLKNIYWDPFTITCMSS